jgi:CRP-like cAMP-binding protein
MESKQLSTGVIAHAPLFANLSTAEIKSICTAAGELRFQRHSIAISHGHPADRLYLLIRGRARFFLLTDEGRKINLRWIVPGQIFGAAAMLSKPSIYLAGAEIVQHSSVLTWERKTIRDLATKLPQLLENCLCIAQDYVLWYVTTHESLVSHTAEERLAHLLIRLSASIADRVPGGLLLDVRNEELANAANISVFTVSRLLQTWQDRNVISKTRNKLLIRSPEQLLRSAKGAMSMSGD